MDGILYLNMAFYQIKIYSNIKFGLLPKIHTENTTHTHCINNYILIYVLELVLLVLIVMI